MKSLGRIAILACFGAAIMNANPASAEEEFVAERATSYAEVLDLPDWSGIWYPDWGRLFGVPQAPPVLTPEAQAELDAFNERYAETGPPLTNVARCIPPGMPMIVGLGGMPLEILYSPGRVTILLEAYSQVRRIYMDGRPLPEDPEPFFNGTSVGHWEGDVLVIETVGLHPLNDFIREGRVEHSEQLRVDERIYQPGPGELVVEMTMTDPAVLLEPYVITHYFKLDNSFPMREYVCEENNRLISSEDGANIDLGFDVLDEVEGE